LQHPVKEKSLRDLLLKRPGREGFRSRRFAGGGSKGSEVILITCDEKKKLEKGVPLGNDPQPGVLGSLLQKEEKSRGGEGSPPSYLSQKMTHPVLPDPGEASSKEPKV